MKTLTRTLVLIASLVLTSTTFATGESWNAQMSSLAKSLSAIMPMIFDANQFEDPKNRELLKRELKVLRDTSTSVNAKIKDHGIKTVAGDDPAVVYLANEFNSQIEFADDSFKSGDFVGARLALRPALSYCISCHTRSSQGPSFAKDPFKGSLDNLRPTDRMAVLTATRQYDQVLKELPAALRAARGDVYQIEYATRVALAVSVRVKNSPTDAMRVLDLTQATPDLPKSTERALKAWRTSSVSWAAEKQAKNDPATKLERAEALILAAEKKKTYIADNSADLEYLRASATLHEYLRENLTSSERARAYQALGKTYEAIKDLGFWELQDVYFEACVRETPHSPLAKQCFAKLEESLVLGYTGSAGTHLPSPAKKKLSELKKLAE